MTEYKCKHCGFRTTSVYSMKSHAETHHSYSHSSVDVVTPSYLSFDTCSSSDSSSSDSFSGGGGDFGGGGASGSWGSGD